MGLPVSRLSKRSLFCTWLGKTRIFYQFSKRLEKVLKHTQRRGFYYNAPAFRIGGHCLVYDDICFGLAPTGLSIPAGPVTATRRPDFSKAPTRIGPASPGLHRKLRLKIRCSKDGSRFVRIACDGEHLEVKGDKTPEKLMQSEKTLRLQVFLGRDYMEIFSNAWIVYTESMSVLLTDLGIELFSE